LLGGHDNLVRLKAKLFCSFFDGAEAPSSCR
jgi:hypothetical protein